MTAPESRRNAERVVDASVVVLALSDRPEAGRAAAAIPRALVSSVGLAEVAGLLAALGLGARERAAVLASLECEVVPFDAEAAAASAGLPPAAMALPLGARACLALALGRGLPVLTGDPRWAGRPVGPPVKVLR